MSEVSLRQSLIRMGSAVFITYLAVALALPVVSVHVTRGLGLANWLGGVAVGIAFLSTILSRKYAGHFADFRSPRGCTFRGIAFYVVSAAVCAVSALPWLPLPFSYGILIIGRLLLGIGESMALVGLTNWHFSIIGPRYSGRILAIVGMAMYGAFAVGGPVGLALYESYGFGAVMAISFLLPLVGMSLLVRLNDVPIQPASAHRKPFMAVVGMIWRQGAVVCLQGVGFAVLGAFISLYFESRGWPYAGLGLSCFGGGFVLCRVFFGGLPDAFGGVRLAFFSLMVEMVGQFLLWTAPDVYTALAGALLTGLGCSMIFPAMGVEVVKIVPPELRGTAFGGFAAFQDLAYAFSAPFAGLLADAYDYPTVFMVGAIAAGAGILITLTMRHRT